MEYKIYLHQGYIDMEYIKIHISCMKYDDFCNLESFKLFDEENGCSYIMDDSGFLNLGGILDVCLGEDNYTIRNYENKHVEYNLNKDLDLKESVNKIKQYISQKILEYNK